MSGTLSGSPPLPPSPPSFPLFSRHPTINEVIVNWWMWVIFSFGRYLAMLRIFKCTLIFNGQAQIWGLHETPRAPGPTSGRAPLHPLPPRDFYGSSLSLRFAIDLLILMASSRCWYCKLMTHRRRPWLSANLPSPPAASSKPSLDGILCTSLVALTNKHRLHYEAFLQELCTPGCVMESQRGGPANGYN